MKTEERDYIYLRGTEELGDVIDALKMDEAKEIILVVPRNTKCLLHPTNLEILKQEVQKLKKKIYISTEDDKLISLSKNVGIEIFLEDYEYEEAVRLVTDILPPQKQKPKIILETQRQKPKTTKKKSKYYIAGTIALIIFLVGLYNFINNTLAYAVIEIYPQREEREFNESIILDPNAQQEDLINAVLPAEYVKIEKTHTIRRKTTGVKPTRSLPTGKVKFINEDEEFSISIIQGTRLQTPDGRIYRTTEKIYLEPQGTKEVYVIADKANKEYEIDNLDIKFSIPGLIGTRWENKIKAVLVEPIVKADEIKMVTLDDINKGKISLEKEINEQLLQELKLRYRDYIFPENASLSNFKILDISHSVGQKAEEIILTGMGSLETIGVNKDKLNTFIRNLLAKEYLQNSNNINLTKINITEIKLMNFDIKNKTAFVEVKGTIIAEANIDTKKIVNELMGKTILEAKEIINKNPQILKASLHLRPFWLQKLPLDISKIDVKIK